MGVGNTLDSAKKVFLALLSLGLIGILFLIIYGNLSGNLGFASGTTGYNNTEAVIGNLTSGATQFFSFSNTWFILTAVTVLIGIVLVVINLVTKQSGSGGGFSG